MDRKPYNWRLLGVLVVAMLVSIILVTPYALAIQANTLKSVKLPLPLTVLIPIQWVAATVLYGIFAGIGLVPTIVDQRVVIQRLHESNP